MCLSLLGLFILGLFFGSFASVLITRFSGEYSWNTVKTVLRGRSECLQCKNKLTINDLIPLLSYFVQKGKCNYCGKKISAFYPMIEIISGLVFVLTYLIFPWYSFPELVFWIFINWSLMIVIISDIKYYELNIPVYIILLFGTILFISRGVLDYGSIGLKNTGIVLVSGIKFFLAYLGIYYFSKGYIKIRKIGREGEGFGFGDVLFSFFVGILIARVRMNYEILYVDSSQGTILLILGYILLSCIFGILYYLGGLFFVPKKKLIVPFLPAMIFSLRIVVLFPKILGAIIDEIYILSEILFTYIIIN